MYVRIHNFEKEEKNGSTCTARIYIYRWQMTKEKFRRRRLVPSGTG